MQYRCYSCGFKLGEGIPPVEALNMDQRIVVGETDGTGLRMDGMSGYSFCEFCLLFESFFGHMDKKDIDQPEEHYVFSDYGRVIWKDDKWSYYDSVLANRLLMMYTEVTSIDKLPLPLSDRLYDQMQEVKATQIRLDKEQEEREMEAKKLHNRIKKQVRHLYLKLRMKVLPYHLEQGFMYLWWTLTMPKNMSEDEQADFYEVYAWQSQNWEYENDRNAPFAGFELWAMQKYTNRFFKLYNV